MRYTAKDFLPDSMNEEPLKEDTGFEQWLQKKEEGSVVGLAICACDCPLSHYLTETIGLEWGVTSQVYELYHPNEMKACKTYRQRSWGRLFVSNIDSAHTGGEKITREEALDILHENRVYLQGENQQEDQEGEIA